MEEKTWEETEIFSWKLDIQMLWHLVKIFKFFISSVHINVSENTKLCTSLKLTGEQTKYLVFCCLSLHKWSHIKFSLQGSLCTVSRMSFLGGGSLGKLSIGNAGTRLEKTNKQKA